MGLKDNYRQILVAVKEYVDSNSGGSSSSINLTDEELLELLEVTDLVDTVNVIIGGVEYKLADTDGSVLYFY